jgi:hypothetical protein
VDDDTVSGDLGFQNVHYFAAGATMFGGEAMGAYQYEGKEYFGPFAHAPGFNTCVQCHDTHNLEVNAEACSTCHIGKEHVEDIRMYPVDFDGDGDTAEGIAGEVETLGEALYVALQTYAADVAGTPIVYNPGRYPYWFTEDGGRYGTWTPTLLRAAYNYQYFKKDPGGFAHNGRYIIQALYDSLEDVGGDTSGLVRP